MIFDLQRILRSKSTARDRLVHQPLIRKLRMLDRLREREIAIRAARQTMVREHESIPQADDPAARPHQS